MGTTKNKTSGGKSAPKSGRKSAGGKKAGRDKAAAASAKPTDPREPLAMTAKNLGATMDAIEAVVAGLEVPPEPVAGDLVDALIHCVITERVSCGIGQEVLRRFEREFVDRNEFRVTEAFEVEEMLCDLAIPDLFERCRTIQQAANQIYNDQNKVTLDHLREAAISERKSFFQRVPAVPPHAVRFLGDLLAWEEIVTSPRSTQRVQQRVGLDPKRKQDEVFVDRLRAVLGPFGHVPLRVGADRSGGVPVTEPVLSPVGLLVRLAPGAKK